MHLLPTIRDKCQDAQEKAICIILEIINYLNTTFEIVSSRCCKKTSFNQHHLLHTFKSLQRSNLIVQNGDRDH